MWPFSIKSRSNWTFKRFSAYRPISESDDWALKGEEALLKNLKKPMIKQFKTVLKAGHKDTPCIPMLRPGDGRLQVHYKKWRPHVITCRLYRWPDLLTHLELYPTAECQTPYTAKSKFVCLNPYHYRREKLAKVTRENVIMVPRDLFAMNLTYDEGYESTKNKSAEPSPVLSNETIVDSMDTSETSEDTSTGTSDDPMDGAVGTSSPIEAVSSAKLVGVAYEEPLPWCSIRYYEHNMPIGEVLQGTDHMVLVDGMPESGDGHMHLGGLCCTNSVSQEVRRLIGTGMLLYYMQGEVFLENISEVGVFVQSCNANQLEGREEKAVIKVTPGEKVRIFNGVHFSDQLASKVHVSYEAVFELVRTCQIRISFVKGFGDPERYHRKEAIDTPCWVELTLFGPLKWLDKVLVQLGRPDSLVTSTS